jgi:DNA-binding MarR family transcriptional regulator
MVMAHSDVAGLTDAVTRLRRALRASIRTDIDWETLPMAQVEVLLSLADHSPARVSDLGERLHLAPSTASGLVAQLLRAGLVGRDVDPDDRRASVVTLTRAGRDELRRWSEAHVARLGDALDVLPERQRRAVLDAVPALSALATALVEQTG